MCTANVYIRTTPALVIPVVPFAWVSNCSSLFPKNDVVGGRICGRSIGSIFTAIALVTTFNFGIKDVLECEFTCCKAYAAVNTALKGEGCLGCVLNVGYFNCIFTDNKIDNSTVYSNPFCNRADNGHSKLIALACGQIGFLKEDLVRIPVTAVYYVEGNNAVYVSSVCDTCKLCPIISLIGICYSVYLTACNNCIWSFGICRACSFGKFDILNSEFTCCDSRSCRTCGIHSTHLNRNGYVALVAAYFNLVYTFGKGYYMTVNGDLTCNCAGHLHSDSIHLACL